MCTVLLAYRAHPRYRLILAVNRDEFYQRPTAAAACWEDAPQLFAGRDLVHRGTWLGVTAQGRIAALTNYRDPREVVRHGESRGHLVSRFLQREEDAERYLERLREKAQEYSGFNLLLGDPERLYCYSNRSGETVRIEPGVHGLSNHLLNTPWPKVRRGKEALAALLAADQVAPEELFALLADHSVAPDHELPDTGVGLDWERLLSPIFIKSAHYGTRSSTVLLVGEDLKARFIERSYDSGGKDTEAGFDWSGAFG